MANRNKQRGFLNFVLPAVGSIAGALIGKSGQQDTNETNTALAAENRASNAEEAQKNRDWQEHMSNTSYQRAVGDMRAAGLNPMLAYGQGGAHTGSGATASSTPATVANEDASVGQAVSNSAMAAMNYQNAKAQNEKIEADAALARSAARLNESQVFKVEQDTRTSTSSAAHLDMQSKEIQARIPKIMHEIDNLVANTKESKMREEKGWTDNALIEAKRRLTEAEEAYTKGRTGLLPFLKELARADSIIRNLEVPASEAQSEKSQTWWGRNVSPYIRDLLGITNSAGSVNRLGR